jgi:hypothetical protein
MSGVTPIITHVHASKSTNHQSKDEQGQERQKDA